MTTASAFALPQTNPSALSLWLKKGLTSFRAASARTQVTRQQSSNTQEAEKLRALARDMMRIDAGSAADMYAAADRHEFGHRA